MRKELCSTLFVLRFSYARAALASSPRLDSSRLPLGAWRLTAPRVTHVIAFFGTRFARRAKGLASARLLGGLRE
jgi:hypothetical protein